MNELLWLQSQFPCECCDVYTYIVESETLACSVILDAGDIVAREENSVKVYYQILHHIKLFNLEMYSF